MPSIDQFLSQNILCCVSSLVSDLAKMYGDRPQDPEILEEAWELSCMVEDYEESAIQAGWTQLEDGNWTRPCDEGSDEPPRATSAQDACYLDNIYPYAREVYEHWAVTPWLGEKLAAYGEKVGPLSGLTIWARTTTGQSISMDGVIQRIYNDMMRP